MNVLILNDILSVNKEIREQTSFENTIEIKIIRLTRDCLDLVEINIFNDIKKMNKQQQFYKLIKNSR
jgi:hypothetical protein